MVLCGLLLASCATTEDSTASRRDLAVQTLREDQGWKSEVTRIEPPIMPSARREASPADGSSVELSHGPFPADVPETDIAVSRDAAAALTSAATPGPADEDDSTASTEGERGTRTGPELAGQSAETAGDPDSGESTASAPPGASPGDDELLRGLLMRTLKQWDEHAGGYSDASTLTLQSQQQRLARDLVTLSFLSYGRPLDRARLEAAAMTLSSTGDRGDLMRAALTYQQLGKTRKSEEILQRLFEEASGGETEVTREVPDTTEEEDGGPETVPHEATADEMPESAFELVSVTFASRIDGPGDFVRMAPEDLQPGKDILVYGEFAGFRTIESRAEPGDPPTHSRAFSARLHLQDAKNNVLDELGFLPPSRGRQSVHDPEEPVNFWARYEIPDDLAAGDYVIVISAEDRLGGQSATAELGFEVR